MMKHKIPVSATFNLFKYINIVPSFNYTARWYLNKIKRSYDPETAPIVQEIFTRYANGEPAEKIAASLNERGLRTRTGKPFVKNSFFQIFRNRRYIGEYRYKDIVTPGGIPAIVDEDLFNRVQQRFEQNKIAHGRPAKEDVSYLLTTKLFCGKCGTLMGGESGTSHMGNTYYYYKCGNAKRHGKAHCDLKAIAQEAIKPIQKMLEISAKLGL